VSHLLRTVNINGDLIFRAPEVKKFRW